MPLINEETLSKSNKKFKKKNYRPWDLEPVVAEKQAAGESEKTKSPDSWQENQAKKKSQFAELMFTTDFEIEIFIKGLFGVQKNILTYLLSVLEEEKSNIYLTKPFSRSDLVAYTKSNTGTVSTSLFRLQEKGVIKLQYSKKGKGSFSVFAVHHDIVNFLNKDKIKS